MAKNAKNSSKIAYFVGDFVLRIDNVDFRFHKSQMDYNKIPEFGQYVSWPVVKLHIQQSIFQSFFQKLVLPYPQFVTFAIVSRCFENKNNNCCETKMPYVYNKNGPQIHFWPHCDWDVPATWCLD